MSSPPHVAILAVALIGIAGAAYLFDNTPDDPLADAASGVTASLVVHAGIFDGATGGPAGAISARFESTKQAASFVPAAMGTTFRPMGFSDGNEGGGGTASCVYGLQATIGAWDNQDSTLNYRGPSKLYTPKSGVQGYVYQGTTGVSGTTVSLFRNGAFQGSTVLPQQVYGWRNDVPVDANTNFRVSAGPSQFTQNYCTTFSNYITTSGTCTTLPCPGTDTGGGGSGGGGSYCTGTQDASFRAYLSSRGINPDCIPNANLGLYWMEYVNWVNRACDGTTPCPPGGSSGGPIGNGTTSTSALVSVTLAGTVATKNLAQDVTLTGEFTLKTAAGKTITRSFPTTKVAAAGGAVPSSMKVEVDLPKADIGTGVSTIDIKVTAASQDFGGEARAETATLKLQATTDYRGSVSISIRAASLAGSIGMPTGESAVKSRVLAPVAYDPIFGS